MNFSSKLKNIGWVTIGLCGICCALPIFGVFLGIGILTTVAIYLELIAIGMVLIIGFFILIARYKKKQSVLACDIDCNCKSSVENK